MLISQRIAADPNFLSLDGTCRLGPKKEVLFALRLEIINSVKFLIDDYGLSSPNTEGGSVHYEVLESIFGTRTDEGKVTKKEKIFRQFVRPPFPRMCLETKDHLLFVAVVDGADKTQQTEVTWQVMMITSKGQVMPAAGLTSMIAGNETPVYAWRPLVVELVNADEYLKDNPIGPAGQIRATARTIQYITAESLMFMNCQNVVQQIYRPTRKEQGSVPKVLHPHFSYRLLDIFRERKQYVSLESIQSDLWTPREEKKGRAHLVRGHFKHTKHGLFWWNAFMRNRENKASVGEVKKTYVVYTDA